MKTESRFARRLVAIMIPLLVFHALTAGAGSLDTDYLTVNNNGAFHGSIVADRIVSTSTNGLLLYYSFNTDATPVPDDSGNGNAGTANGATWTTNGAQGGAYSFDGANDNISVPDSTALNSPASFLFWAYIDSYPGDAPVLLEDGYYIQSLRSDRYPDSGWYISTVVDGFYGDSSSRLPIQQWTHVAFVYDAANLTLYLNGVQKASQSAGAFSGDGGPLSMGMWEGVAYPIDGILDEVRLYDRALSASEVQLLYQGSTTATNTGSVAFRQGIDYVFPLGDLSMGVYTNKQ